MVLVDCQDISKTFRPSGLFARRRPVAALDRVSFRLDSGQALGLVGESGSGKTTLARIVAGFLSADGGAVAWEGKPQAAFSRRQWAARVQMVFQDPTVSLNPKLSVRTQLAEAASAGGGAPLESLLADVGLPPSVLPAYPHQLSGGQKQRVAIARALAPRPKLLIADEPVSSLDLSVQAQILNLLADLKTKLGLTLILISHDLTVVRHMTDRVLVLDNGRAAEAGPTLEVLANPQAAVTRALLDAVPALLR